MKDPYAVRRRDDVFVSLYVGGWWALDLYAPYDRGAWFAFYRVDVLMRPGIGALADGLEFA